MKALLVLLISLSATIGFGQQLEHFTQYQYNQFAFNPAIAGTKNCIDIRTGYRFQWVGIDGAPQTGFINAHAPLRLGKKATNSFGPTHGIGGQIKRDAFGPYSHLKLEVAYSLHIPLSRTWTFSLGAAVGFMQTGYDASLAVAQNANDPAVPNNSQSFITFPDGKVGLWIRDKRMYFGMSVNNLFGNSMDKISPQATWQRHLYATIGRSFPLEKKWSVIPSAFLMWTKNTPIDFHIGALMDLDNKLSFGVGLRRTDAVTAQIRVKFFNWISLGYSFDFVISKLSGNMWYTHELTGGFNSCSNYGNTSTTECPSFE